MAAVWLHAGRSGRRGAARSSRCAAHRLRERGDVDSLAGAWRTASTVDRFLAAIVRRTSSSTRPTFPPRRLTGRGLARRRTERRSVRRGVSGAGDRLHAVHGGPVGGRRVHYVPELLEGRWADPAAVDELTLSEVDARKLGKHVGDTVVSAPIHAGGGERRLSVDTIHRRATPRSRSRAVRDCRCAPRRCCGPVPI